jgi:hypothetical protein
MADWRMRGTNEGLQLAPVAAGFGQELSFASTSVEHLSDRSSSNNGRTAREGINSRLILAIVLLVLETRLIS